jgi:hypothetical protein
MGTIDRKKKQMMEEKFYFDEAAVKEMCSRIARIMKNNSNE